MIILSNNVFILVLYFNYFQILERRRDGDRRDRDRERDRERNRERDRERGERRQRSRCGDRKHYRKHRSRSHEGQRCDRSKSPKTKSKRRKPSLNWDVPPPGFEHIAPLQYKAMQGKLYLNLILNYNTIYMI